MDFVLVDSGCPHPPHSFNDKVRYDIEPESKNEEHGTDCKNRFIFNASVRDIAHAHLHYIGSHGLDTFKETER